MNERKSKDAKRMIQNTLAIACILSFISMVRLNLHKDIS